MTLNILVASTLQIVVEGDNFARTGTGFIYSTDSNTYVITNKHVIKDAHTTKIIATLKPQERPISCTVSMWLMHPTVDLAALPINTTKDIVCVDSNTTISQEELRSLNYVENVLVIGYPETIADKAHNLPICRLGITATHPAIDYNGNKEFLIDCPVHHGSSGSPVFLYNAPFHLDTNGDIVAEPKIKLLGVLYRRYFEMCGDISVSMDLGVVIKAQLLSDFDALLDKKKSDLCSAQT